MKYGGGNVDLLSYLPRNHLCVYRTQIIVYLFLCLLNNVQVNNAGCMVNQYTLNEDGLEVNFVTNTLG